MDLTETLAIVEWTGNNVFDLWLIRHINNDWSHPALDWFFSHARETLFWMPLYLFLFIYIMLNYGKRGIWWVGGVILVAVVSDVISSHIIKELIFRTRPCRDPEVAGTLRFFINYCPQSSGFTSSHATSHFAQACFFYLTLRHSGKIWVLVFLWAFLIAYGQVYVGVHYPLDVIAGGLIGTGIGYAIYKLLKQRIGRLA